MILGRRELLAAFGALGLTRVAWAQGAKPGKTLVVLFMRGGVDGLAMVPPVGDADYRRLRPNLRDDSALALDGMFALHSSMAPLLPWFKSNRLAVVQAVGQHAPSRSHFDAQDFLESGLEGEKANDGWLNRALETLPASDSAFRAVALQNGVPVSMQGPQSAVAFAALKDFRVGNSTAAAAGFEALYAQAVDDALRTRGAEAFQGMQALANQNLADAQPRNGAVYPQSPLGRRLQDVARLVHAGVGLQVAATEAGGFDTHLGQGGTKGQLAQKLQDLAGAVAAFATDLGDRLDDVCLVTMTEFGRTACENGTRGTDHGTASAMFVLGGGVRGGRVIADWPGLKGSQLFEGRDLKVTTNIRSVLAEVLSGHLNVAKVERALPGATATRVLYG